MNWRAGPSSDARGPVFMDSARNMRIISRARDLWTRRRVSGLNSSKLSRGYGRVMSKAELARKQVDKAKLIAWHVLGFAVVMSFLGAGIWWLLEQEAGAGDHHLNASADAICSLNGSQPAGLRSIEISDVAGPSYILLVCAHQRSISVGQVVTLSVHVHNNGDETLKQVRVRSDLPVGATMQSWKLQMDSDEGEPAGSSGPVVQDIQDIVEVQLHRGDTLRLEFQITVNDEALPDSSVRYAASVSTTESPSPRTGAVIIPVLDRLGSEATPDPDPSMEESLIPFPTAGASPKAMDATWRKENPE